MGYYFPKIGGVYKMKISREIINHVITLPINDCVIETQEKVINATEDTEFQSFEIVELLSLLDVFEDGDVLQSLINELERGISEDDPLPFIIMVDTILNNFKEELKDKKS